MPGSAFGGGAYGSGYGSAPSIDGASIGESSGYSDDFTLTSSNAGELNVNLTERVLTVTLPATATDGTQFRFALAAGASGGFQISKTGDAADGVLFKYGTLTYFDGIAYFTNGDLLKNAWTLKTPEVTDSVDPGAYGPAALRFSDDGLTVYVRESSGNSNLRVHALTEPYDLATLGAPSTATLPVASLQDFAFGDDGGYLFAVYNTTLYRWVLSTPYDVSTTGSQQTKTINANPYGVDISDDGTKVMVTSGTTSKVYLYTLPTPYSLTSAALGSEVASSGSGPTAPRFRSDGKRFLMLESATDEIEEWRLSTAWDLTTATLARSYATASFNTNPFGFTVRRDGALAWITGNTPQDIHELELSS